RESHHKREGLRQQDNASVCAAAPEWRLAFSDRSRLTTGAASIAEVWGKWTVASWEWDALTKHKGPLRTPLQKTVVFFYHIKEAGRSICGR
ncbi:hypothetical protein CHARACLAT_031769, partial [Characodon lateralis]|nr:hypothetical protein [Characodon lateralis]